MSTTPTIAWLMRAPGCDGSADWIEPGAARPEPMAGFEAVPLGDVREMQTEVERLRDALQRERASSGRYMEERNQARLQAQREVGDEVRKLRAERDEMLAALREIAGEFAPGSGRQTYGPPAEAMDRIRDAARAAIARAEGGAA